jgi:hypothetical protein
MNWARKGFVHVLALLLLVSLLAGAATFSIKNGLSQPEKIKDWLSDSRIYDKAVSAALSQAQADSAKTGDLPIALNSSIAQQAANQSFSVELVQDSTNSIIDANYAWLNGKSPKPEFSIDLSQQKKDFAEKIGQYVTDHLNSLPICNTGQLAQLQIPINSLTVSCRPSTLDPKTEGTRIASEVEGSTSFLGTPVVTADSIGGDLNSQSEPYYKKLDQLPMAYQRLKIAPIVLALVAVVLAFGVAFIHPSRRKGYRRVAVVFTLAGLALIASKFLADKAADNISSHVLSSSTKADLNQPLISFLHKAESQVTTINLAYGILFLIIAGLIFGSLLASRQSRPKSPKKQKPAKAEPQPDADQPETDDDDEDFRPDMPSGPATGIGSRMRQPRPAGPPPLSKPAARPTTDLKPTPKSQSRPPKRPRLIQ